MKTGIQSKLILLIFLLISSLQANMNDEEKILILTNYLITQEHKDIATARSQAISSVYGVPSFKKLVYDDSSEMFFATIVSEKGNFSKNVNFYMPQKRAKSFLKSVDTGKIKIAHSFRNNKLSMNEIELEYDKVDYPLNIQDSYTMKLKVGGFFVVNQETDILARRNGVGGIVNLQDSLNMQTQTQVFRITGSYKFNETHALELSYFTIKNSNSVVNEKTIEFDGTIIEAGSKLSVHFNTDIYKFNYIYSAYHTNKLNLTARVGLHATNIATGIEGDFDINDEDNFVKNESVSVTAPLPVFGIGIDYKIIPNLYFKYTLDYFYLSYDAYAGLMLDNIIALEYNYNKYLGLGVAYNDTTMKLEYEDGPTSVRITNETAGLLAYLTFSY